MDRDDGPEGISFEAFLNQKPVIKKLIQDVDLDNVWIVFALVLVLEKEEFDELLDSPNFSGAFKEFVETWLNANPVDSRRQLLKNLRGLDLNKFKPFAECERKLMDYETRCHTVTPDHFDCTHKQIVSGQQNYDQAAIKEPELELSSSEMKIALARNKIEIQELKRLLSIASDEKSDLERNLETKDEEINDLKESAQKKDDEMKDAKEKIEKLERSLSVALDEMKRILETKDKEINDLNQKKDDEMKDTKDKIQELERSLSLALDDVNKLKRSLETKVQEIDDLTVSIKEKDNESDSKISELQNLIRVKEEELSSRQQLLTKKEKGVNTLSQGITANEQELASFRELSQQQLQEIVAMKLKLADSQKDIAEKESMIKSTNEELLSTKLLLSETQEELKKSNDELERLRTQNRISKAKDREIEDLKAKLYQRNEQDIITSTKWSESEVRLTSPSAEEITEVLTKIKDNHRHAYLSDSSSHSAQLLVLPLLQKRNISSLYIFSTPLTRDFIDLFSSQMLDDSTIESLYLNHNSISDDGVITLVQFLKHNKKLLYLSLDFNTGITSASIPSLAEFIRINCTLSVLYISRTSIDAKGVLELVNSLKFNKRLGKIVVDQKHKAMCTESVGKINRLDFSYTTATAYEHTGITKI